MKTFSNPKYLRTQQYKTPQNLKARANLHIRFQTNPYPWHRWVFDQMQAGPTAKIVDIGCGPAYLWAENLERIPEGCFIHLMDLSGGMLTAAKRSLTDKGFSHMVGNVQQIPLENEQVDIAVANHMLYHVPDIQRALKEIRRTLKPSAKLIAATNGFRNLIEIWEWVAQALPTRSDIMRSRETVLAFSLENGAELLSQFFSTVKLIRYPDSLEVNEVQSLVDFVASSNVQVNLNESELSLYKIFLEKKLATENRLRITKDMGIFVAE